MEAPVHFGLVPLVIAMVMVGVTLGFTVIVIALDVAVKGLAQLKLLVITQVTICPFVNVVVVNVALLVPAFTPFTSH